MTTHEQYEPGSTANGRSDQNQLKMNSAPSKPPSGMPDDGPNVLVLLPVADISKWAVGDIRLVTPLTRWADLFPGHVRFKTIYDFTKRDLKWATVLILQRQANPYLVYLARAFKNSGRSLIFEIDDLLTEVPAHLSAYRHHAKTRTDLIRVMGEADIITVTTERLKRSLASYHNDIVPIMSSICSDLDEKGSTATATPPCPTVLLASSDTVGCDFIIDALKALQADPQIQIRIVTIGAIGNFLAAKGLKIDQHGLMSREQFIEMARNLAPAIGVIPLDYSPFSSCKSEIKYVDYSAAGIVSACSAVPPYSDAIINGVTGVLVQNTPEAWETALRKLFADPSASTAMAAAAQHHCMQRYDLDVAAEIWNNTIRRAEEITRAKGRPTLIDIAIQIHYLLRRGLYIFSLAADMDNYRRALKVFKEKDAGAVIDRAVRILRRS